MTDADVIVTLGGPTRLASALDMPLKRVGNWTARGIPWRHRHRVVALLVAGGHAVPAGFMGGAR